MDGAAKSARALSPVTQGARLRGSAARYAEHALRAGNPAQQQKFELYLARRTLAQLIGSLHDDRKTRGLIINVEIHNHEANPLAAAYSYIVRITKQTSYAIRILIHCALAETSVRSHDIARLYGISEYNVSKIIPTLVRAGFLATNRGRHGGLKLARPPEEISIGAVLRVTEVTHVEADCVGGASVDCAVRRTAPVNRMFGKALEAFISVLDQHTLADLISNRLPMPAPAGRSARAPVRRARAPASVS